MIKRKIKICVNGGINVNNRKYVKYFIHSSTQNTFHLEKKAYQTSVSYGFRHCKKYLYSIYSIFYIEQYGKRLSTIFFVISQCVFKFLSTKLELLKWPGNTLFFLELQNIFRFSGKYLNLPNRVSSQTFGLDCGNDIMSALFGIHATALIKMSL